MENKLQELTNKIYAEGIDKAKKEAEQILEEARKEAGVFLKDAEKEAAGVVEAAKKEAEETRKNVTSEVKLSSRQAINKLKQEITDLITVKSSDFVKKAFDDQDFLRNIMIQAVKNWSPNDNKSIDIELLLPEKDRDGLLDFFRSKQKELLDSGLKLTFDDSLETGFKIGPGDGSYKISFTGDDFENFFKNYLRPRTTQLLYSGEESNK